MSKNQKLIFIYGPMCSGKSTLANKIAEKTLWKVVDSDEVMSRIHPESDYNDEDRLDMYFQTFKSAVDLFNEGNSVIISSAFTNSKYITLLKDTGLYDLITKSVLLQVSPEVAVERWIRRKVNPKIQTEEIVYTYASKEYPKLPNMIIIDSNNDVDQNAIKLVDLLV